jgi:hypothetical protein
MPPKAMQARGTADSGRAAPFLCLHILLNGPRRQGFATPCKTGTAPPRKNRAPLTAPGRSCADSKNRERGPLIGRRPFYCLPLVGPTQSLLPTRNLNLFQRVGELLSLATNFGPLWPRDLAHSDQNRTV